MSIVLDTSAMLAYFDPADAFHSEAASMLGSVDDDLVSSPLAVAEMDHMVRSRAGRDAQHALWTNLRSGAITVRWWADAMAETLAIASDRPVLSLADASLIALCDRVRTDRIAAFDAHFDTTTPGGRTLVRLPGRRDH